MLPASIQRCSHSCQRVASRCIGLDAAASAPRYASLMGYCLAGIRRRMYSTRVTLPFAVKPLGDVQGYGGDKGSESSSGSRHGRGIFATRDLRKGDVLFKEQPFVAVGLHPKGSCGACLKPLRKDMAAAAAAGVVSSETTMNGGGDLAAMEVFCGLECEEKAWGNYLWVQIAALWILHLLCEPTWISSLMWS